MSTLKIRRPDGAVVVVEGELVMTDVEQLSALLKARGIVFAVEQSERYGTIIRTAEKTPPPWNESMSDAECAAAIEKHDELAGYDHFYAVLQFDETGKLVHIGAYE